MAKKKVNKTEAIKEALAAAPDATPTEIAHSLKLLKITPGFVSQVKTKMKGKKTKKNKATKKKSKTARKPSSTKVDLGELIRAKKMAEDLGGVDKAKEVLDALAKLR